MENNNQGCVETIDIEGYAKVGKKIPQAEKYRIRIDKEHYVVLNTEMTGGQLLAQAGKQPPERYALYQKLKGGETVKIELNQKADFTAPGVERFMTLPLDQTEGAVISKEATSLREHFHLPDEDLLFLDRLGLPWETVSERNVQRVVIYDYSLPQGYKESQVDLNVRIERTYPDTQIDMVYFSPAVERVDGGVIRAICNDSFDGKNWQRWSRHRTPQNPWRPGIDNLESHLMLVREWLLKDAVGKSL